MGGERWSGKTGLFFSSVLLGLSRFADASDGALAGMKTPADVKTDLIGSIRKDHDQALARSLGVEESRNLTSLGSSYDGLGNEYEMWGDEDGNVASATRRNLLIIRGQIEVGRARWPKTDVTSVSLSP